MTTAMREDFSYKNRTCTESHPLEVLFGQSLYMLLAYLHPGDLTLWELPAILFAWAFFAFVFVGLPLALISFISYKVYQYRKG
ncbi:MAG TPA: hypothetical protein VF703_01930 [Pyrinomonadaceae bacterium]|jgi:hypothetical protein